MKPDGALANEMEEVDIEPSELFCQLGMLIVEGRMPQMSPKGRVEGPHCPVVLGDGSRHHCDQQDRKCKRAQDLQHQMLVLWRNKIPMCIEVLLYPECGHGKENMAWVDVGLPGTKDTCILLEQWTIQVIPKRCADCLVPPRVQFQAIRSFLHFSQLSSWLNRSHGIAPRNIGYRVSPPGEFCTSSFSSVPVCHTFPVMGVSKAIAIKANVSVIPRCPNIPKVPCSKGHETDQPTQATSSEDLDLKTQGLPLSKMRCLSPENRSSGPSSEDDSSEASISPNQSFNAACATDSDSSGKVVTKRKMMTASSQGSSRAMQSQPYPMRLHKPAVPNTLPLQLTQHQQQLLPLANADNKQMGAIPKKMPSRKSLPIPLTDHQLEDLKSSFQKAMKLPLESPKVIVTQKSPGQDYFSRDKVFPPRGRDNADSDSSSPEIDTYLKSLASQCEPLSPPEMETYLASLAGRCSRPDLTTHDNVLLYRDTPSPILDRKSTTCKTVIPLLPKESSRGAAWSSPKELKLCKKLEKDLQISSPCKNTGTSEDSGSVLPRDTCTKIEDKAENGVEKVEFIIGDDDDTDDSNNVELNGAAKQHTNGFCLSELGESCIESVREATQTPAVPEASNLNRTTKSPVKCRKPSELATRERTGATRPNLEPQHVGCVRSPTEGPVPGFGTFNKGNPLLQSMLKRDLMNQAKAYQAQNSEDQNLTDAAGRHIPTPQEKARFRRSLDSSASMLFHAATGLPLQSSPAPTKKKTCNSFDYDYSLTNIRAIKNSISCVNLDKQNANLEEEDDNRTLYSKSAPASTNCLLGNFEESLLNGRIEPLGVVDGFTAEIGASGAFCPKHVELPVTAFFFSLSDDNAPSPYLGHINLESLGKRGYHVPKKGTVQVTLFNPNKTVVKMFVVMYDLSDMPPNCQTFLRQRTLYMPLADDGVDNPQECPVYLRYLIHLRFSSSKSGKIYLHTDIRLIFARDKFEYDSRIARYELRSFTEGPKKPKFSPKR